MRLLKTFLPLFILINAISCGGIKNAVTPTDQAAIQGTWLAQTESLNGIKKDVTFVYEFKGNEITFTDETGAQVKYLFTLETAGNLKFITLLPAEKTDNPTPVSVAYELKGNWLTLVIAPAGKRPTEISDKNDQELIVCKRKGA
jgi:uncharacterized protein (TIGR03067 family)